MAASILMEKVCPCPPIPYLYQKEEPWYHIGVGISIVRQILCNGGRHALGRRRTMIDLLLQKLEESDAAAAAGLIRDEIGKKGKAWEIHLSLFPVAQRVLNPPFINPHLPKMYRICREFHPYLRGGEIPALVMLEINEYARRPKLEKIPRSRLNSPVSFTDLESAIRQGNREKAAAQVYAFQEQKGKKELARRLLLLGSGYLDQSLGHSVSCTAFILLEMMERTDQDPWPTLATLADYFCKGQFHTTPDLPKATAVPPEEVQYQQLLRAASGPGIVNLHHTITRYAVERVRHLLSDSEYSHMIARWIDFMGAKSAKTISLDHPEEREVKDYAHFYRYFSKREEKTILASLAKMVPSEEGRQQIGSYLIKGICDLYQGNYDPHYLTGLASALWVVNHHWNQPAIAINALAQYANYFFSHMIY